VRVRKRKLIMTVPSLLAELERVAAAYRPDHEDRTAHLIGALESVKFAIAWEAQEKGELI